MMDWTIYDAQPWASCTSGRRPPRSTGRW